MSYNPYSIDHNRTIYIKYIFNFLINIYIGLKNDIAILKRKK